MKLARPVNKVQLCNYFSVKGHQIPDTATIMACLTARNAVFVEPRLA